MIRHPLIAVLAVLSICCASSAMARSGAAGAGHGGVAAGAMGAHAGASRGGGMVRGSVVVGTSAGRSSQVFAGYRSFSAHGYGRQGYYGARVHSGGYTNSGAYGVAPFGTPTYVAAGVFVPGNPTQTPVAPPAIYQIERSVVGSRTARQFTNERRPGIYPVGVSDGIQPSIYVVRVPRG